MAYSTVSSELEKQIESQIAASSFEQVFGASTLSQALSTPIATQSTRVRRAIKDSYKKNIDQENIQTANQTFDSNSVDDSFRGVGESIVSSSSSSSIDNFEETDIYVIIDGIVVQKKFLTQDS